jgi:hypothetical protein
VNIVNKNLDIAYLLSSTSSFSSSTSTFVPSTIFSLGLPDTTTKSIQFKPWLTSKS